MSEKIVYDLQDIMAILPHRPPFLFVDQVTDFRPGAYIETERYLRNDEPFFAGHFPGMPIMPGVLVTDALAQTSGLLLAFSRQQNTAQGQTPAPVQPPEVFFLAAVQIKYTNPAYPGDTLVMTAQPDITFGGLYSYNVEATVKRSVIAAGRLTLAITKGKV